MNFDMKKIQEWLKNNQMLAVGAFVSLLAIIAATWFLFHGMSVNAAAAEELASVKSQLEALQTSNPYPNRANIEILKKENERLNTLMADFEKRFAPVPVPPSTFEDSGFKFELEDVVADLKQKSIDLSIQMPTNRVDFAFSFSAQRTNLRNDTNSLKIQAEQLAHVKYLCNEVMDSGITEFIRVRRAVGTTNDLSHISTYLADYLPACNIITNKYSYVYPYEVVFKTSPGSLAQLVNSLEQSPYGVIIKCIQIERAASEMSDELADYQELPMMNSRYMGRRGVRGMPQPQMVAPAPAPTLNAEQAEIENALPKGGTKTVLKPTAIRVMMLVDFLRLKTDEEISTEPTAAVQGGMDTDGDGTMDVDAEGNLLPGASADEFGNPLVKSESNESGE